MNFNFFYSFPAEEMKKFMEYWLRSSPSAYQFPIIKQEDAPWILVDQEGKQFADCKTIKDADKFLKFLEDLDGFFV